MDKKIKFLFIVGIAILLIVIFFFNILIKRYERETMSLKESEGRQKSSVTEGVTVQKQERPELPEEPEKEPPISETGPLLN